jgi:hypothetical protein
MPPMSGPCRVCRLCDLQILRLDRSHHRHRGEEKSFRRDAWPHCMPLPFLAERRDNIPVFGFMMLLTSHNRAET